MLKKLKQVLKKQQYGLVGNHSGVKICNWCKNSLTNNGECYKNKFYGIPSHRCCQLSTTISFCQNRCIHCWRAIELTIGNDMKGIKIDSPEEIFKGCLEQQKKLLSGFKGNKNVNKKKLKESEEPNHFAISLTGEPTLYSKLPELIKLLRKKGKTTFIVSNGLNPNMIKELEKQRALPTQLYISLNSTKESDFKQWHNSKIKNPWKKYSKSLKLLSKLNKKTRTVLRMTLVKGTNNNMKDEQAGEYAKLIQLANPDFIEVKGFISVGFARQRKGMGYDNMPYHDEIKKFSKKILSNLKDYKILDEHRPSKIVLLGKSKAKMKIKKREI